ncbi:MAG: ParB N-terminal domain-containing protein [Methanobrevibacter sp.]|nr:ParB N-terminal domain-containing protein [Methanobrevibacter sp.]
MIKIIEKNIDELVPYENNARINDKAVEAVANSISDFGFKNPVIIDKNNVLVAGHTRVKAAKKLGLTKVPCIIADDLDEDQIKAFRIADNSSAQVAEWDMEKLMAELQDIDLDMSQFGLDEQLNEIADMIIGKKEVEEDDFDVDSAIPEEPKAKLGDIYQLGEHRLMCGNALKIDDIEKLLNGNKCELTFTDPPYQLDTKGGGILKKANSMKQIRENGVDNFEPSKLILVSDTNIYCHNKPLIKSYIELAEQNKKPYDLCFYKKECTVPNYKGHLMTDCEYIAVIGNQDPNKRLEKELYSKCYVGKKDSNNELSYSKPVGLCAKYVKLYAKDNVLDLFGGSGSTLIACEQLNRKCYMMELDPKYVDVIINRWEQFTGKKAVKLN